MPRIGHACAVMWPTTAWRNTLSSWSRIQSVIWSLLSRSLVRSMDSRRRSLRNPITRQYRGGSPARLRLIQTGPGERSAEPLRLHPGRAAQQVVVDQAHGLHEGVDGGGADERPAPAPEILAQ